MNTDVPSQATTQTRSLYERLGSSAGLTQLVDTIVDLHMKNPAIKARFLPYQGTPSRLAELKGHLVAFMTAGSGGPNRYEGRSMPDAHRGMNVSEAEYMAAVDDILEALAKHGADEQSQKDVLAIAFALKAQIIRL